MEEEIGFSAEKVRILGHLTPFYVWVSNFIVLPVIGYTQEKPEFEADLYEVERVIEAPLKTLLKSEAVHKKNIQTAVGSTIFCPYYDVKGNTVWGATAMMLSEFIEIVRKTGVFQL